MPLLCSTASEPPGASIIALFRFISVSIRLKDDILLAQPADHPSDVPPLVLPLSIKTFLSSACQISQTLVDDYWVALKETVWNEATSTVRDSAIEDLFHEHGQDLGFCALFHFS
jgi:hypothetical protein